MSSDDGAFLQEYFVYFKKKQRSQGAFLPEDAVGDLIGVYSKAAAAIIACPRESPSSLGETRR